MAAGDTGVDTGFYVQRCHEDGPDAGRWQIVAANYGPMIERDAIDLCRICLVEEKNRKDQRISTKYRVVEIREVPT